MSDNRVWLEWKGCNFLADSLQEARVLCDILIDIEQSKIIATQDVSLFVKCLSDHAESAASYLGRKGGLKGGKARSESLSPARRSEIAKIAAQKRWAK